jgi:NAD(P)-dependent dehydrogenase (short-subunit alcohol dehydrogenase family)
MDLTRGRVAVVTGAASGIGLALAERFSRSGLNVVLADVDETGLDAAVERCIGMGVEAIAVKTDVSDEASVHALASAALSRFGAVHIVCNNAGVASMADPWFGPRSTWDWVLGVNLWGVIHGVRTFLPILAGQEQGHIVNTASIAGLMPGFGPSYDASKHAVVALTEDLYLNLQAVGLPIGVSVLCPGWVRTRIIDADRNWPAHLGDAPPPGLGTDVVSAHVRRAIDEGTQPGAVADLVADAVQENRFWVFPNPEFVELAIRRWHMIADRQNPAAATDVPGMPNPEEIAAEMQALFAPPP